MHNLGEILRVYEGLRTIRVVFGEHFYGCSEFLVKAGSETSRTLGFCIREFDLISVQSQSLNKRLFGLAFAESIVCLEIGEEKWLRITIQGVD